MLLGFVEAVLGRNRYQIAIRKKVINEIRYN